MIDQLPDSDPIMWILLQAFIQKIPGLTRDIDIRGNFNLILDDFDEFFLFGDFKRIFAHHHFVHHYAK